MRTCDGCGNREATFILTEVESGRAESRRLCAACA